MNIRLIEKSVKKGTELSLYLDIYMGNGNRQRESLKLRLFAKPTTAIQRNHNAETKKLAERLRANRLIEIQEGQHGLKLRNRKFTDFVSYFELLTKKRKHTGINYNHWYCTEKHLLEFVKETKQRPTFAQINKDWLEDFKLYLLQNVSQNSAASYFNILRHSIHQATRDKFIVGDPLSDVKSPQIIDAQREFLTLEEIQKLAATPCKDELVKRVFLFGCLTGLRISDMIKLKWSEVQFSTEQGWHIVYTQKKTQSNEVLQINEQARAFLGEAQTGDQQVFKGLTYSDRNNRTLKNWALAAGVQKHVTPHTSRHTTATMMLNNGTDIYTVSKILGHKKIATTQIYAKVMDATKRTAVDNLPTINVTFYE